MLSSVVREIPDAARAREVGELSEGVDVDDSIGVYEDDLYSKKASRLEMCSEVAIRLLTIG